MLPKPSFKFKCCQGIIFWKKVPLTHERQKPCMSNSTRIFLVISKSQLEKHWLRTWVSTGAKGAWQPRIFWIVMSGTRWFWQFYYIMFCCTLEFWGFISDLHPLFQTHNSSPVDCNKNKSTLGKSMTRTITMKKKNRRVYLQPLRSTSRYW